MRRPPARKSSGGVSLFPFLAVLICTMGALIVLLVLVVKQAEVQAKCETQDDMRQQQQEEERLRTELEDQEFLRNTLANQRPEMTERLAENRWQLSHLENHIRQLKQQADQLAKDLDDLNHLDDLQQQNRSAAKAELEQIRREIELARQQLEEAQRRATNQRRSFAIVPYDGPHGTTRRPIFIECTGQAVILQPEGIALQPTDFDSPLVPGNPLDAALLAIREYLSRSGVLRSGDEPYPLLIVRPSGAEAYAKARAAMRSWDDEFGYELIDDQLVLQYPPADPGLAGVIRQAIDEARRRQAVLAAAQPSRFLSDQRGDGRVSLRARPHSGGFIRQGGSPMDSFFDSSDDFFRGDSALSAKQLDGQTNGFGEKAPAAVATPDRPGTDNRRDGGTADTNSTGNSSGASDLVMSRGLNWGLPSKAPGAIAFTRPIRVVCYQDRLVIVPQEGAGERPSVTPLDGPTRGAIDAFVSSVWKHMEGWGIAGRNAYWKPILHVEVAPSGQERFAELESLLQGSGLDVKRK